MVKSLNKVQPTPLLTNRPIFCRSWGRLILETPVNFFAISKQRAFYPQSPVPRRVRGQPQPVRSMVVYERPPKPLPTPPVKELYQHRNYYDHQLCDAITSVCHYLRQTSQNGFEIVFAEPKSWRRIFEKARWPINDMFRCSLVFKDRDSLTNSLNRFRHEIQVLNHLSPRVKPPGAPFKSVEIIKESDYFQDPKPSGLRFYKVILAFTYDHPKHGEIVVKKEVQFHLKDFFAVASSRADHRLYELAVRAKNHGHPKLRSALLAKQQALYKGPNEKWLHLPQ